jgi:glutathione S-transferase
MADLTLYLGNKNYSSWSLRAWLAASATGEPFDEVVFDLGDPGVRAAIRRHSPTGRVPALRHGDLVVWDSLAISEYLSETWPEAALWPRDRARRAAARAVCAEMHSGFAALRRHMPMNVRRSSPGKGRAADVKEDIERVLALWHDSRARFGAGGDFLFGRWTLADCFFAPVVSRFRTYAVEVDETARAYMDAAWSRPEMQAWRAAAGAESAVEPEFDL